MTVNLPPRVRLAIFMLNLLGTPVIVYALAKGWIGELELTLWGGEVAAAFALAGLNVPAATSRLGAGDISDDSAISRSGVRGYVAPSAE